MAFCELRYFSKALGMQTAAHVLLPESEDRRGPFPVFYLLHGLSDDHTIWTRRTSIERYVQDLPLIVVMPAGGRGFYVDAREGFAYGTAIARDLVGLIDWTFPTRAERGGRCIGGLSMGGYGALKLALAHPDLFCSANSHSGALAFGHRPLTGEEPFDVEFRRVLGENPVGGPHDLFALAGQLPKGDLPALRIDCGTEDFLIEDNRAFHTHLTRHGIPHEYEEFPGAHEWGYWDEHVREAFAFHRRQLGI
jgi:S-formylglutathione hydrolase FrmB